MKSSIDKRSSWRQQPKVACNTYDITAEKQKEAKSMWSVKCETCKGEVNQSMSMARVRLVKNVMCTCPNAMWERYHWDCNDRHGEYFWFSPHEKTTTRREHFTAGYGCPNRQHTHIHTTSTSFARVTVAKLSEISHRSSRMLFFWVFSGRSWIEIDSPGWWMVNGCGQW